MLSSKGIITEFQKEILHAFARLPDAEHFYLTGGTALADFYLAHRKSFDLDIFTTKEGLVVPFSRVFEKRLQTQFSLKVIRRLATMVDFQLGTEGEETRVQLAYDSPYRFGEPVDSDVEIKVNDYKDLVVDKLLAFFGRVEPRDAVDLFFILESEDIWKMASAAAEKDPGFDLYWLAVALEKTNDFPDDISRWPVEMIRELDVGQLKERFLGLAREILVKIHTGSDGI